MDFTLINPTNYGYTWLDIVLIFVLLFYTLEGIRIGFINAITHLISFAGSFFLGIRFYSIVGSFIASSFSIPQGFSSVIGFFVVALFSEIILSAILILIRNYAIERGIERMARSFSLSKLARRNIAITNRLLGVIPNLLSATLLLTFLLSLVVGLPFAPVLKKTVTSSKVANYFLSRSQFFEQNIKNVFGGAVNDTLTFFTIEPKSDQSVPLSFRVINGKPDPAAEEAMLRLINQERQRRRVAPLIMDSSLRLLARQYSSEMFSRGFFSHYTPEGLSPFDRMNNAGTEYIHAGENLALAPNVYLAMQGLMQSPGHRANMLSSDYGKVGIGVIDGGIYGEMFTQEFTN